MRVVSLHPIYQVNWISLCQVPVFFYLRAISNFILVWWKMSLLVAGGLEPDDPQGPFQPKPFYDFMILGFIFCHR